MPRQDVPYGGAICRLKERIAELFDLVGQKLHSINGVEGDGQGDVKILSDDPAVVITNDAVQNEIKIGLDSSELPSAAVSSVNGETGAVVLDGNDIDAGLPGGLTVTDELGSNKQQLQTIGGLLQQEVQDRQNADSALQTNINQVQAGMPAAAAAAVAADPTVAQLAVDVPNKVDKITSGSTKRAYTHTGAVQDDTPVVNGTDANSIGLRDANGRMYAADPASGATDRSLTTANWISQTGAGAPNNLFHKNGNETADGIKIFSDHQISEGNVKELQTTLAGGGVTDSWVKLAKTASSDEFSHFILYGSRNNSNAGFMDFWVYTRRGGNTPIALLVSKVFTPSWNSPEVCITLDSSNNIVIWGKQGNNIEFRLALLMSTKYTNVINGNWTIPTDTTGYSKPTTQDYTYVVDVV